MVHPVQLERLLAEGALHTTVDEQTNAAQLWQRNLGTAGRLLYTLRRSVQGLGVLIVNRYR